MVLGLSRSTAYFPKSNVHSHLHLKEKKTVEIGWLVVRRKISVISVECCTKRQIVGPLQVTRGHNSVCKQTKKVGSSMASAVKPRSGGGDVLVGAYRGTI